MYVTTQLHIFSLFLIKILKNKWSIQTYKLSNVNRLSSDMDDKCWLENLVDFEY